MTDIRTEICLVDDEVEILGSFSEILSAEYNVSSFTSAHVALQEFAKGFKPQVIVTDLRMPELDGLGFIQKLREKKMPSDIILVSGNAHKADVAQALSFGVAAFLEKPYSAHQIRKIISQTTQNSRPAETEVNELNKLLELQSSLEKMGESFLARAREVARYTEEIKKSLNPSVEQRLQYLDLIREQRSINNKITGFQSLLKARRTEDKAN